MKILGKIVLLLGASLTFGAVAGEVDILNFVLKKVDEKKPIKVLKSVNLLSSSAYATQMAQTHDRSSSFSKHNKKPIIVAVNARKYAIADGDTCHHVVSYEQRCMEQSCVDNILDIKSSCKDVEPDKSLLGLYEGTMDGKVFIQTKNISKDEALKHCRHNSFSNPKKKIKCKWNGDIIHSN